MQRNRFGFSDFVLSRYASPMIIAFTFVSSIWVVSYLTQQALGPALRRKKFPRPGDDERHMKADLIEIRVAANWPGPQSYVDDMTFPVFVRIEQDIAELAGVCFSQT
jgi:hypothetical protein